MAQRKAQSITEVCLNVGSGFIFSLLIWELLVEPCIDVRETFMCNLGITLIYTVASVARGYFWRRIFNKEDV